LTESLKCQLSL